MYMFKPLKKIYPVTSHNQLISAIELNDKRKRNGNLVGECVFAALDTTDDGHESGGFAKGTLHLLRSAKGPLSVSFHITHEFSPDMVVIVPRSEEFFEEAAFTVNSHKPI